MADKKLAELEAAFAKARDNYLAARENLEEMWDALSRASDAIEKYKLEKEGL